MNQSTNQKPNILFLMTDQHRWDCIGAANPVVRTPNLDRLAEEGVRFCHAYSSTPTCTPARAAILTGLSPWRHGMLGFWRVAERYPVEMPRALKEAGYYTCGIGVLHYYPADSTHGFDRVLRDNETHKPVERQQSDYHKWFEEVAPGLDPESTGLDPNDYRARAFALPEELHQVSWTGNSAVDFLRNYDQAEPFFLKVSFVRPHSPYDPPARFMDMYRDEDMPLPHIGDWAAGYAAWQDDPPPCDSWHGDFGGEQVQSSRHGYYASVSFVDEWIGRILRVLEEQGMLDNTFILFASDHGDMLGDHHLWRKSYPYEGSTHIPMLMRWPKSMDSIGLRGREIPQPTELRDILPTFLDVAGQGKSGRLDGDSLLKLARGETSGWREFIDLEHDICYDERNHWNALTDGKWKYIFHAFDGSEQLFHLEADPGETRDLSADPAHADVLACWRSRLVEHLSSRGEEWVSNGRLISRPHSVLLSPNYPG